MHISFISAKLACCSVLASLLFGCASVTPLAIDTSEPEHISEKNYVINKTQTAYVGQPIARVKDYHVNPALLPHLEASNNFVASGPMGLKVAGEAGRAIPIRGETLLQGRKYLVFPLMTVGANCFAGLVDENGVFNNTILSGLGCSEINPWDWTIEPLSTRFNVVKNKTVDKNKPFTNFELLYGGTDGNSFSVSYREYAADDLARVAFHQELTFRTTAEYIRYKNLRVKVHKVNNEEIEYSVMEDGV